MNGIVIALVKRRKPINTKNYLESNFPDKDQRSHWRQLYQSNRSLTCNDQSPHLQQQYLNDTRLYYDSGSNIQNKSLNTSELKFNSPGSNIELNRHFNCDTDKYLSSKQSEILLHPPNLHRIGRASSFGGRRPSQLEHTDSVQSTYSVDNYRGNQNRNFHYNQNKSSQLIMASCVHNSNQSNCKLAKRGQLNITPSIEISLAPDLDNNDNNDNNDENIEGNNMKNNSNFKFNPDRNYERTSYSNESSRKFSNLNSPVVNRSNSLYVEQSMSPEKVSSATDLSPHTLGGNITGSNNNNSRCSYDSNNRHEVSARTLSSPTSRRARLIRQSRSFQNTNETDINNKLGTMEFSKQYFQSPLSSPSSSQQPQQSQQHLSKKIDSEIDDFDYFCRIANLPKNNDHLNNKAQSLGTNLSHNPGRSHSMREASPEFLRSNELKQSNEKLNVNIKNLKLHKTNKINHLKPPTKGQLRRASTEDDTAYSIAMTKRPIAATLSYTSVTNSYSNLCTTPPKSIPQIPTITDKFISPTMPLGVPLSTESVYADEPGLTFFQVQVLGATGVGKTCLCHQLTALNQAKSSSYDLDDFDNREETHSITAVLYGSIYTVNFVDTSADNFEKTFEVEIRDCTDAFLIVYAIDDMSSFEAARLMINALTPSDSVNQSHTLSPTKRNFTVTIPPLIYLVANKSDLVRGRQISTDDGRHLASLHGAKFIEVSSSLNHMIADLFVSLIGYLRESEIQERDPRLPISRRIGSQSQSSNLNSSTKSSHNINATTTTFKIPSVNKTTFSKFFKKHFTRSSQESDEFK